MLTLKKTEANRLRLMKTDMEIKFRPSDPLNQHRGSLAKFMSQDTSYHQPSVNLLSFRKSKKKKNENMSLVHLNKKMDLFLSELGRETADQFADRVIAAYKRMEKKDSDISSLVMSLLDEVNCKSSELKKLLRTLEVSKVPTSWGYMIEQMDSLTSTFFELDKTEHSLVHPSSIFENYSAILCFQTFAKRFQEQAIVLLRRICNQMKKSRMLLRDTEDLEYFIETLNRALDEVPGKGVPESSPHAVPYQKLTKNGTRSWSNLSLLITSDGEKEISYEFVRNSFMVLDI
jgi:hypothetical protein